MIKVFECMGSFCRQPDLGRPSKVTHEVKDLVKQQMVRGLELETNIRRNKFLQKVRGGLYSKGA